MQQSFNANFSSDEKKYFKMGEACDLLGVRPHVLRYWEAEFAQIKPHKSTSGQRLYRRADIDTLNKIYHLLYREKFTIAGAQQALKQDDKNFAAEAMPEVVSAKNEIEKIIIATESVTMTSHVAEHSAAAHAQLSDDLRMRIDAAKEKIQNLLSLFANNAMPTGI